MADNAIENSRQERLFVSMWYRKNNLCNVSTQEVVQKQFMWRFKSGSCLVFSICKHGFAVEEVFSKFCLL